MSLQDASIAEINNTMIRAKEAFKVYRTTSGVKKAELLRAIEVEMSAMRQTIIERAMEETNLPEPRLAGEFGRTTAQLKMFASLLEEGSWVEARIDTALPERTPAPRPDLRKMLVPIGPVVVFGASNFPLAFSTAGGDTASALAAGCPVIVKAHPAHAKTSELVATCILQAVKKTGMPDGVFAHVQGSSTAVGQALVEHPLTKAVGFTGSYTGGKALFDLANKRPEPIPVFSEMGSVNPVFLLPGAIKNRTEEVAKMYAGSITQSVGQFCTNPGLLLGVKGKEMTTFVSKLGTLISEQKPGTMLYPGIAANYQRNRSEALKQKGVEVVSGTSSASDGEAHPTLATVSLEDFADNEKLKEEVFGPYSIVVQGNTVNELSRALDSVPGQLTATIIGEPEEFEEFADFISEVREKAGRVIINGVPTGVEVCASMQHGGPFPATTDSRFTSVGTDAIKRFVRPVCFQNFPNFLLPDELKNENPLNVWRMVNNEWTKNKIV